mgnify:CR=1 FL=1
MFKALQNVSPSQLADRDLFDFAGLDATTPDSATTGDISARGADPIALRWFDRARLS